MSRPAPGPAAAARPSSASASAAAGGPPATAHPSPAAARPAVAVVRPAPAAVAGHASPSPQALGRAATVALYEELALAPKPGLVSFADSGSHADMDGRTFLRSLFALRGYFVAIARLGAEGAAFPALEACGQAAEARMLAATGGINTHRGAVFSLGLLCAAGGAAAAAGEALSPATLRARLRHHWGPALQARRLRPPRLPGGLAAQRLGLRSASDEAADAFPVLFDHTLPTLQAGRARGLDPASARLDALLATVAVLDDSNLALRGGRAGLDWARAAARDFLAAGGAGRPGGRAAAWALHRAFVVRRLSPGGAADLLAAACWLDRVGRPGPAA